MMRATPEYKTWLVALSGFTRFSLSTLTDKALESYAAAVGFPPPPARTRQRTKTSEEVTK
jgi:hypothetical protein